MEPPCCTGEFNKGTIPRSSIPITNPKDLWEGIYRKMHCLQFRLTIGGYLNCQIAGSFSVWINWYILLEYPNRRASYYWGSSIGEVLLVISNWLFPRIPFGDSPIEDFQLGILQLRLPQSNGTGLGNLNWECSYWNPILGKLQLRISNWGLSNWDCPILET